MSADPLLIAALGDLTAEVRSLRSELAQIRGEPVQAVAPIFVADAAAHLGISRETLDRVIRQLPEDKRPPFVPPVRAAPGRRPKRRYFWPDRATLLAWWADVSAPPAALPTRPKPARKPTTGVAVTDWRALARTLS